MTEKLYYADSFLTEFTARALSCEKTKNGWEVQLDRTAFYPEGGGQPGHLVPQTGELPWGHQPQVAALHPKQRTLRDTPQDRNRIPHLLKSLL